MRTDIKELLDNIRNAHRQKVEDSDPRPTLGDRCKLQLEDFPPASECSDIEIEAICSFFINMLHSWNLEVGLPEALPRQFYYEVLTGFLTKKTDISDSHCLLLDHCIFDPSNCVLREHCSCREFFCE